ncbi:unnamed protein product [Urochloa humidicola]
MILAFINTVVIGGTGIYPVFCATLFPWSTLWRCLRRSAGAGDINSGGELPQFAVQRRQGQAMNVTCFPGRGQQHSGVHAEGRRRAAGEHAGVTGVPMRGGGRGDGDTAAGVPSHVPPEVHRPVAGRALDVPGCADATCSRHCRTK